MKTKLFVLLFLGYFALNAQTTHNLEWFMGVGTNVDLTIDQGDTVKWTWTDAMPHTVENEVGNSVETFNSGILTGVGQTFSYTFTVVGENNYFCVFHPGSMSGTITVSEVVGFDENELSEISIAPNPASTVLQVILPKNITQGQIMVYDVLGRQIYQQALESNNPVSIDVSKWSAGNYIINVVSGNRIHTQRFIKN